MNLCTSYVSTAYKVKDVHLLGKLFRPVMSENVRIVLQNLKEVQVAEEYELIQNNIVNF
jgi:hypothetical protein